VLKTEGLYQTDLTDEAWALIAPILPAARPGGIDQISQELSRIHQQRMATEAKAITKIYASLNADQKATIDPEVNRSLGVPSPRGAGGRRGPRPVLNGNAPQPAQQ
jgi:hypothetical protein